MITQLEPEDFDKARNEGYQLIDLRTPTDFAQGFIEGSLCFSGTEKEILLLKNLFDTRTGFLVIPSLAEADVLKLNLFQKTFPNIYATLKGGMSAWTEAGKKTDVIISIDAGEFLLDMKYSEPRIVDIRAEDDFNTFHLEGSANTLVEDIISGIENMPDDIVMYMCDEDGSLSMLLISWMRKYKFYNFYYIAGGVSILQRLISIKKN